MFNLALDEVIRDMTINWNGTMTIFSTSKQITAFADDADLIGRSTITINKCLRKWIRLNWTESEQL